MAFLGKLADVLWNPWLLGLFLLTGAVLTVGGSFFPLRHFRLWWRETVGSLLCPETGGRSGGLSSLQAVAAALASTMGTGSIAGVAAAIWLGGPGAVFWMWISALLGLSTGCVETLLAVKYQVPAPGGGLQGGPMFYLRDGLRAPKLAAWFSLACLPAALAGGGLIQSSSIASALSDAFGIDRLFAGCAAALLAGLVLFGGVGRIARVSQRLVPAMALLYLGCGALVLWARREELPQAFALIFSCALTPESALGGGGGYALSTALRHGVARGVFTNEAGLGTSAMAHGAARTDHPARQGMWGIFEVFFSTLVVCTVTALVILVSGVYDPREALTQLSSGLPDAGLGVPLTARAFASVLGRAGERAVALSLLLFAFSSILGWSYYGEQGLRYLSGGDRRLLPYRLVFLGCVVLGAVTGPGPLWQLVDLCSALMALPNLTALLLLSPQALSCLRGWVRKQGKAPG